MDIYYSYENVNLLIALIGAIIIIHMLAFKKMQKRTVLFANYETLERAMGKKLLRKNYLPLALRSFAVLMIILAISNLTITLVMNVSDVDFVMALDTSPTMSTSDNGRFMPNRLEAAKESAISVVNSIPQGTRVGLVSFSGKSYRALELTDSRSKIREKIRSLEFQGPAGTATGDAIINSALMLSNSTKKKVIAIITDGDSNEGISVDESLKYAAKYGIAIHAIGIGPRNNSDTEYSTYIPESLAGKNATEYKTPLLDEESLVMFANVTGGKYYYAASKADLGYALEGAILRANSVEINASRWALIFAVLLLILEWALGATKYKTIP